MSSPQPAFQLFAPLGDGENPIVWNAETRKMATKASAELPSKHECSGSGLKLLLTQLSYRAAGYGWKDTILEVPQDASTDMKANRRTLTTQYGQISLDQVKAFAERIVGTETLAAQHDHMMFECLSKSLTDSALKKVSMRSDDFTLKPFGKPQMDPVFSGVAFLKVIIQESYIDTNFTVRSIRENLSSLDLYMGTVKSDIKKFNEYVLSQLESLHARGEETKDLLPNLFKGYKAASDSQFCQYIERKEEAYDDGQSFTAMELMQLAKNKYAARVEQGLWDQPDGSQAEIVALKAEIQKLKTGKGSTGGTNQERREIAQWMKEAPKANDPKSKKVKGKTYHWCEHHGRWVRHKPEDCKLGKDGAPPPNPSTTDDTNSKPETGVKLKLAETMQAVLDGSDDEE